MKKMYGMTIAQKSKETSGRMKDGNGINLCSVYPANNPYRLGNQNSGYINEMWYNL